VNGLGYHFGYEAPPPYIRYFAVALSSRRRCNVQPPSDPTNGDGAILEVFSFESLPQMVATSDLVIEGTVREVKPGRVVGGEGAIQFAQVTVSVDRVLFGRTVRTSLSRSTGSSAVALYGLAITASTSST
jgi:hypothetical protein